jgi:hypothetical protein
MRGSGVGMELVQPCGIGRQRGGTEANGIVEHAPLGGGGSEGGGSKSCRWNSGGNRRALLAAEWMHAFNVRQGDSKIPGNGSGGQMHCLALPPQCPHTTCVCMCCTDSALCLWHQVLCYHQPQALPLGSGSPYTQQGIAHTAAGYRPDKVRLHVILLGVGGTIYSSMHTTLKQLGLKRQANVGGKLHKHATVYARRIMQTKWSQEYILQRETG